MKRSRPIRYKGLWRILRFDGAIVGAYATRALAQAAINRAPYLW